MNQPAPNWRAFLRALAAELDIMGGTEERDAFLREIGRRMAEWYALPPVADVTALEQEMNEHFATWGWGSVEMSVDEREQVLKLVHTGLPRVGVAGDPPGTWLSPVLEGIYDRWLRSLPEAPQMLKLRRETVSAQSITLLYGKPPVVEAEAEDETEEFVDG